MHRSCVAIVALGLSVMACQKKAEEAPKPLTEPVAAATPQSVEIDESLLPAFGPLPATMESKDNPLTPAKIALGRVLYSERRLSASNELSCASCHALDKFGVDGEQTSEGHKKQRGARNSPTVYNAAGHFAQFWDGRAKTVEEQAKGPITNPIEMAMTDEKAVVAELKKIKAYEPQFKSAFPEDKDPITMDNIAKAIGAFERTLVTPSRWDAFLKGDKTALTEAEKAGFKKFTSVGCNTCHAGPYVGGQSFQKLGLAKPWPKTDDLGRYLVTKQDADKMFFKIPSLRNVAKTAPYFHDGSVATLDEAITLMGKHQLGVDLSVADVTSIAAFLGALTGELPKGIETNVRPQGVGTAADGGPAKTLGSAPDAGKKVVEGHP